MRHREMIAYIASRLPHQTNRDVEDVIDVLIELMQDELMQGETASLPDIGTLSIEVQNVHAAGAVRRQTLTRVYGRFRPAGALKKRALKETRI
ncbi:MAG TPA: HU family DNA-binding protein [Aggregatilinea sp.]|uniref:HU family DNA-binding protein n=1 Tax=Aggregatilinea sp. TaxID=2806333 RepID=UPI002CD85D16|nr:HU family DNA-binding protein [Aggregatilinea sp.]HML23759.1 HU family DNA-binding protein [Aggregatilinea sp.]